MISTAQCPAVHEYGRLRAVAGAGFVILYPIFFFYHYLVGMQLIGPILAGLYGPASLTLSAIFLIPLALLLRRTTFFAAAFYTLIVYCSVWIVYFGFISRDLFVIDEINEQHMSLIVSWIALFSIGLFVPVESTRFGWITFGMFALMTAAVLFNFDTDYMMFRVLAADEDTVASYQGFSRSYFFVSLLLLASARTRPLIIGLWLVSAVCLFAIGARSEFAAFIIVTVCAVLVRQRGSPFRTTALVGAITFAGVYVLGFTDRFSGSRQLNLLDLAADNSWNAREAMMNFALWQINESPILGIYGGHYLYDMMNVGSEAHNFLSAWVSFGLLGVLLYLGLTLAALWIAGTRFFANPGDIRTRFALLVAASVAILSLTSKSVFWGEAALAWGIAASFSLCRRRAALEIALLDPGPPLSERT